MTTIAYDGKTLATDSRITNGTMVCGNAQKLFVLDDGRYLAVCGALGLFEEVACWLNGGDKPIPQEGENVEGIIVDPNTGEALEFNCYLRLSQTMIPYAGGSGAPYALAAMKLGKSAVAAVKIACELDTLSGGTLQVAKVRRKR